jgi:hypothetical protein
LIIYYYHDSDNQKAREEFFVSGLRCIINSEIKFQKSYVIY